MFSHCRYIFFPHVNGDSPLVHFFHVVPLWQFASKTNAGFFISFLFSAKFLLHTPAIHTNLRARIAFSFRSCSLLSINGAFFPIKTIQFGCWYRPIHLQEPNKWEQKNLLQLQLNRADYRILIAMLIALKWKFVLGVAKSKLYWFLYTYLWILALTKLETMPTNLRIRIYTLE